MTGDYVKVDLRKSRVRDGKMKKSNRSKVFKHMKKNCFLFVIIKFLIFNYKQLLKTIFLQFI